MSSFDENSGIPSRIVLRELGLLPLSFKILKAWPKVLFSLEQRVSQALFLDAWISLL